MKLANYLFAPVLMVAIAVVATFTTPAVAGEGHDHGDAKPLASGPALPRFAAVSDLFELVGVLEGKRLVLYLDYAATNAPVKDAKLELEISGKKVKVEPHGPSEFEVMFEQEPKDGVLAIAATVSAGKDSDLLAGELDIHLAQAGSAKTASAVVKENSHGHDHKPGEFHFLDIWNKYRVWMIGAAGAVVLVAFGALRARRRRSMFDSRTGGSK